MVKNWKESPYAKEFRLFSLMITQQCILVNRKQKFFENFSVKEKHLRVYVICGFFLSNSSNAQKSVREAVAFAADFVGRVAADTKRCGISTTDGILFERHLKELCPGD